MTIETLGIDIAKTVFQLHGVNRSGRLILKRRMMRDQLLQVIAQTEPCTIAIEACTGAFYWQRKFEEHGHKVKIISPQYVKPFVRRQKTDGNDAEAICTADRHRGHRRHRRWYGVQERPPPRRLGRACPTPALQRSAHRPARHLQTRQPAPEIPARAWRPIRRPHGGRKGGSLQHLGQPASPAAWLQPGHGGRRQQERTDHLGRASERRSLPRRLLRAHHEVARR